LVVAPFREVLKQEKIPNQFSQRMMTPLSQLINATTAHIFTEFTLLSHADDKHINFE